MRCLCHQSWSGVCRIIASICRPGLVRFCLRQGRHRRTRRQRSRRFEDMAGYSHLRARRVHIGHATGTTWNDLNPRTPMVLDVFPSSQRVATFIAYDDDGHTYAYEKGEYFRQEVQAKRSSKSTDIAFEAATGVFTPQFPSYVIRIHQAGGSVTRDGAAMRKFASADTFRVSAAPGWFPSQDRFGAVTEVRLPADGKQHTVKVSIP